MGGSKIRVFKRVMQKVADGLEILLSILLVVVILLLIFRMVLTMPVEAWEGTAGVQHVLSEALEVAIALEFVKVLCLHTPGTILEVLLFAIAKHMIVKEPTAFETLLGVVSIAALFAIHRFLLVAHKEVEHMSYKASSTVGFVNITSGVHISGNSNRSIGGYLADILKEKGDPIKVGASVYKGSSMLRVEKMNGDRIARVELVYKE